MRAASSTSPPTWRQGRVALDDEITRHLPTFRVADEEASRTITIRQLLSHTAGFEGDIFTDHGPGDDAVERFGLATHLTTSRVFPRANLET